MLFSDMPDIQSIQSINNNTYAMEVINKLEGIKTRLKELHWNVTKRDLVQHRFIDEVLDEVMSYQDDIAEDLQSFLGVIQIGTLSPILPEEKDLCSVLNCIDKIIKDFELIYKSNPDYIGAININEGAATTFKRFICLAQPFCKTI